MSVSEMLDSAQTHLMLVVRRWHPVGSLVGWRGGLVGKFPSPKPQGDGRSSLSGLVCSGRDSSGRCEILASLPISLGHQRTGSPRATRCNNGCQAACADACAVSKSPVRSRRASAHVWGMLTLKVAGPSILLSSPGPHVQPSLGPSASPGFRDGNGVWSRCRVLRTLGVVCASAGLRVRVLALCRGHGPPGSGPVLDVLLACPYFVHDLLLCAHFPPCWVAPHTGFLYLVHGLSLDARPTHPLA